MTTQSDYSYLSDPAERQWLTNVDPIAVLVNAHRIYDLMAEAGLPAESVVRELAFTKASDALGVDYDVFYQAWLDERPVSDWAVKPRRIGTVHIVRYWEVCYGGIAVDAFDNREMADEMAAYRNKRSPA